MIKVLTEAELEIGRIRPKYIELICFGVLNRLCVAFVRKNGKIEYLYQRLFKPQNELGSVSVLECVKVHLSGKAIILRACTHKI